MVTSFDETIRRSLFFVYWTYLYILIVFALLLTDPALVRYKGPVDQQATPGRRTSWLRDL